MKSFDYSSIKNYRTYAILAPIARFVIRIIYRLKIAGTENIPTEGGFILACNHVTAIDPVILATGKSRPVHFMSKYELFQNPVVCWFLTRLNAFPIIRGSSDKTSVYYAIRIVKEDGILGIFPEGTRSKGGKPIAPKSGVALIARAAKADVLPVSIYSEDNSKLFTKLTVRFGKIIPFEELGITDSGKSRELKDASRLIMHRITELWEEGHAD
jgi:1-acyl-sn-glycerol-3-phosphate acyltransferase